MVNAVALLIVLGIPTWLFIELAFHYCRVIEWREKQKKNPSPQQIPADDLIGKRLRDVR